MATKKAYGPFHLYEEKFDWRGRILGTKQADEVYVQVNDCHASATLTVGSSGGLLSGIRGGSGGGFGLKPKVSLSKEIPMPGNRTRHLPMEGKKELRIQKGFVGSSFVDVYLGSNMVVLCHEDESENESSPTSKDLVVWIPDLFKKIRLSPVKSSSANHQIVDSLLQNANSSSAVKKNLSLGMANSASAAVHQLQRIKEALIGPAALSKILRPDHKANPKNHESEGSRNIENENPNHLKDFARVDKGQIRTSTQTQAGKGISAFYRERGSTQLQEPASTAQANDCPLRSDALISTAIDVYDVLFDALDSNESRRLGTDSEEDIFSQSEDTHHGTQVITSPEIAHTKRRGAMIRRESGFTPQLKRSVTDSGDNMIDTMLAVVDNSQTSPCKSKAPLNGSPLVKPSTNQSTIDSHFKPTRPNIRLNLKSTASAKMQHVEMETYAQAKRMLSFDKEIPSKGLFSNDTTSVPSSSSSREPRQQNNPSFIRNLNTDSTFMKEYHFSDQQHAIIEACVQRGENAFYTGGGGTGKSILLKHVVELLVAKHGKSNVFVTATTGLAACAIGGTTLHQFLSLPALDENDSFENWEQALEKTCSKKHITMRCRQAEVLIIDEISMLGPRLFELLDEVLKRVRNCPSKPMGGLQLICCGDFLQLPPIKSNKSSSMATYVMHQSNERRFCFQSNVWGQVFPWNRCYELDHVYRQEGDAAFIDMLNEIRKGVVSETTTQCLRQCVGRKLEEHFGILPTVIFTHKKDVDTMNQQRLQSLHGESFTYTAQDSADDNSALRTLQYSCPAKEKITLKIGAQVILVKTLNVAMGLVNGARGVVVRIIRETRAPVVKFFDGNEHVIGVESFSLSIGGHVVAQRSQIPLDLAWAISVHKSQGMTVDQAELHLKSTFECGQAYVALSRVRSRHGLSLKYPIGIQQIKADPIVLQFYATLKQQSTALRNASISRSSIKKK